MSKFPNLKDLCCLCYYNWYSSHFCIKLSNFPNEMLFEYNPMYLLHSSLFYQVLQNTLENLV